MNSSVTGGSRGIGAAIALKFAAGGATVAVHYGRDEAAAGRSSRRQNDGGRIINISSGATRIALTDIIGYSATKGAIDAFTFTLAKHLGSRKITVNAVAPGVIDTDLNAAWLRDNDAAQQSAAELSALGRVGRPSDVADVVGFLASDASGWVTGQVIDATGGSHL